ncbi:MAG: murein hydrolase activator EnvC family protein [Actinomycetota bacterium]
MRFSVPHKLIGAAIVAALLCVLTPTPAPAANESTRLQQTRQQINEIRKKLAAAQGQANKIEAEVNKLDKQINSLDKQITSGQHDISSLESDIRSSQNQIDELEAQYRQAANASNQRARRLYVQGPAESVAMLFSAGSVLEMTRMQFWMEKSSEQDSKVIVDTARLKKDLTTKQDLLNAIKNDLNAQREWLEARKGLANAARRERQSALKGVEKEIAVSKQHIEGLQVDSDRLQATLSRQSPRSSEGGSVEAASRSGFVRPVSGRVTSSFGRRWGRAHTGIDLDGNTGDPIRAAKAGRILGVACGGGYGNCTLIDHGGGVVTLYAHMSRKAVGSGSVSRGQVIGYVGCTGSCTGSHLHFEVRVNGRPQNPARYI